MNRTTTMESTYLHRGQGFGIRTAIDADWPTVAAWFTPEQMRWYSATDLDLFEGGPDPSAMAGVGDDGAVRLWVVDAPDGAPIALQVHQPHHGWPWIWEGELIVAPDRRGYRRVGTLSSALALDLVFHREGAHKVTGNVAVDHHASLVMSERLGYRREGRLRDHVLRREGSVDLWVMGLLRSEWTFAEHLDPGIDAATLLRPADREESWTG